MRREGVAKVLGVPADEIVVSTMRADGDCFYASVSAALAGFGAEPQSIVQLRGLVAEEIGQEQVHKLHQKRIHSWLPATQRMHADSQWCPH